jgi:hypothetical protein|tara:strand:- start:390 stop:509 length:120 start_codon:yes stop_codon:yes gene_type:complete
LEPIDAEALLLQRLVVVAFVVGLLVLVDEEIEKEKNPVV